MSNRLSLTYTVDRIESFLMPDLQVDGRSVLEGFTLDLRALVASTHANGEYWIFTCGCGEPGCARINRPVVVRHGCGEVIWEVPEPIREWVDDDSYRELVFARPSYFGVVREALASAQELALEHRAAIGPHGFEVEELLGLSVEEPWD